MMCMQATCALLLVSVPPGNLKRLQSGYRQAYFKHIQTKRETALKADGAEEHNAAPLSSCSKVHEGCQTLLPGTSAQHALHPARSSVLLPDRKTSTICRGARRVALNNARVPDKEKKYSLSGSQTKPR